MGAPVSKLDNHGKASETSHEQSTDGHLHENKSTCNDVIFDSEKNDGSCETIPKPPEQESEMLQVLCAAADDIDDQEWGDIYKRLKTNRNDDLHIVNARFTRNDLSAFPDGSVKTIGPVFTSTVAERPTRINSANFSPHAIEYEREKSRIKIAIRRRTELTEDEVADEEECEPIVDKTMDAQKETLERELSDSNRDYDNSQNNLEGEHSTSLEKACVNIEQVNDDNVKKPPVVARENQLMLPGENSLLVPADNRGMQSPAPNLQERNTTADADDDDFDPFEGLDIPRQRAYSIGSASIYSVMEISDDMYQLYRAEIKSCIRSYGFFEAFPSPAIISEAQKIYRMLDIPSPVDDDGHILPHPPKVTKNEYLEAETKSFDDVRDKIDKMPDMLKVDGETSDIVHYLCEGLDDDMSKLRIIAAWIVLQQLEVSVDKNKKKETSERWCKLFKIMCKFARIKTRLIKGIIRGPTYVPGEDLQLNRGYWIAVLINYTWLLVDPALKQDINEETNNHTHKTRTNVNLFDNVARIFQDPEEFIFTHFPDDEHWQLLARPVTKDELTEMAVLRPGFFAFDMTVINCPKSVMVVNSAETLISLAFREGILLQFKCKLQLCDNSMSLARSRRYVFLETLLKDHLVNIRVRFPSKGSYILHLIGSFDDENWQSVISYRLDNKGQTASDPFPDSPREEWGPGMDTVKMGLTPHMYHSGEILMQKRVIQIAFSDTERLQFDHVLFRDDININPDYLKVSVMKDKNNDVIFIIDIDSKVTGTFTLQLLARADRRADYTNFCNYLIRKEKRVIIPKLEFNRKDNSSDRDVIQAPDSGELHLTVDATGLIQLTVELKLHDRQELNFSEHARHWICNNTGFIDLNFPRKGKYTMQVLGRTVQKGRFRPVREETIHASIPSARWSCWPKEGANWNSWYKIEAPLSHHLEEKEDITFKVEVKNALDVAVLAANGWYHLDRVDESWLWAGKVWTGPKSTRCRLLTRFEIGSEKWSELLWFKIMAEEDFERMAVRQSSAREIAYKERTGDGT